MVYSIIIPEELKGELYAYAKRTGNSAASIIRASLEEYLRGKNGTTRKQ